MKEWRSDFKKIEPKKLFKSKPPNKAKKPTGELTVMRAYAAKMGSKSEIDGTFIPDITIGNIAHILSKKQYPEFRLNPENLCVMTYEQHREYDQGSIESLKTLSEWAWFFEKRDLLIEKYKQL